MDELDELKRRSCQNLARPRLDTVHEDLEDLVRNSESDDGLDEESPEPENADSVELSLSRWPSNPPRKMKIARGPESTPEIRHTDNTVHAGRSQRFCPTLDSVMEERLNDIVELSGSALLGPDTHCASSGQAVYMGRNESLDVHQPAFASVELGGQVLEAASAILGALSEIRLDASIEEAQPSAVLAS